MLQSDGDRRWDTESFTLCQSSRSLIRKNTVIPVKSLSQHQDLIIGGSMLSGGRLGNIRLPGDKSKLRRGLGRQPAFGELAEVTYAN
jgi:hypothetical protein